jgi:phosphate starvation-inducible PhoH-like protein
VQFELDATDTERLMNLSGQFDQHLKQIENRLGVDISNRGNLFQISGSPAAVQQTINVLQDLYRETADSVLNPEAVHLFLQEANLEKIEANTADDVKIRTRKGYIKPKGLAQSQYIQNIRTHDVTFGIGPAGTGKTWLAVACAVEALERDEVRRLVLVRPAVEAGERLGFLPGDLSQKIDPYLRPMYDALYEMLGIEKVNKLIERNVIEVAPLAYMRGRTLNDAFILLDEAQNTTTEQMKMFLTRLGFGSSAVITGDITQIDLPRQQKSGLKQAVEILEGVKGISFNWFSGRDVVRHKLVQRIVEAYEHHAPTD